MRDLFFDTEALDLEALQAGLRALARNYEEDDLPPWLFDVLGLIEVGGAVASPAVYSIGELRDLPALTQTVTYTAAGVPVTGTYTGVLLADLVADTGGVATDPAARNDVLAHYVVAAGSDGYRAIFSLGEIDPRFGGEQIPVAYDDTLGQLGPDGTSGFARMVVPGDAAGGRYVSNLVSIEVFDIDRAPDGSFDAAWN